MISWLRRLVGLDDRPDRRKYERYPVTAPLSVMVADLEYECSIDNVPAGGLHLNPVLQAKPGESITITHPKSGLSLEGEVVGDDAGGTRIKFDSEEAGTIVSVWVRMLNEED